MTDQEIIKLLHETYGKQIVVTENLPMAYCPGGIESVRAIYLGCDPSNVHSTKLPYAFAHESGLTVFQSFIKTHTKQLIEIGLSWETVYTQNLCRNYFDKETANNKKFWAKVAKEYWIPMMKKELPLLVGICHPDLCN